MSQALPPQPEHAEAWSVQELAGTDNRAVVVDDLELLNREIEKILGRLPGGQALAIARAKASELLHWIAQARSGNVG